MEMREAERLDFYEKGTKEKDKYYVEIDMPDMKVRAGVLDISLKGLGVEITGLTETQLDFLRSGEEMFLKIHTEDTFFIAGVRNIWNSVDRDSRGYSFKGGMMISVISPQDNIQLADFIEKIREGGGHSRR